MQDLEFYENMAKKYSDMCGASEEQYDDFLQESKMAFYNSVLTYNASCEVTFGAYAKVCVRNRLVSCVRTFNSQKRQETLLARELEKKLFSLAQDCLSAYERKIFTFYIRGERAKEISQKIGKSERSVNNAIYRIKVKLKQVTENDT